MGIYVPEDGSMFGLVAFAPGLPQLRRAAPDVVVALAFALGLSVVSAAGLALVLRDLIALFAVSAHVGRGLRRDGRRRRGAAPDEVVALAFALLLRVEIFAFLALVPILQAHLAIAAHRRGLRRDARRRTTGESGLLVENSWYIIEGRLYE